MIIFKKRRISVARHINLMIAIKAQPSGTIPDSLKATSINFQTCTTASFRHLRLLHPDLKIRQLTDVETAIIRLSPMRGVSLPSRMAMSHHLLEELYLSTKDTLLSALCCEASHPHLFTMYHGCSHRAGMLFDIYTYLHARLMAKPLHKHRVYFRFFDSVATETQQQLPLHAGITMDQIAVNMHNPYYVSTLSQMCLSPSLYGNLRTCVNRSPLIYYLTNSSLKGVFFQQVLTPIFNYLHINPEKQSQILEKLEDIFYNDFRFFSTGRLYQVMMTANQRARLIYSAIGNSVPGKAASIATQQTRIMLTGECATDVDVRTYFGLLPPATIKYYYATLHRLLDDVIDNHVDHYPPLFLPNGCFIHSPFHVIHHIQRTAIARLPRLSYTDKLDCLAAHDAPDKRLCHMTPSLLREGAAELESDYRYFLQNPTKSDYFWRSDLLIALAQFGVLCTSISAAILPYIYSQNTESRILVFIKTHQSFIQTLTLRRLSLLPPLLSILHVPNSPFLSLTDGQKRAIYGIDAHDIPLKRPALIGFLRQQLGMPQPQS